jgi:putative transposase
MALSNRHSGWRQRGYLPHLDQPGLVQAVTFRLADSLPQCCQRLATLAHGKSEAGAQDWIEAELDRGLGACVLKQPACANLVQNTLLHFDHQRYRMIAWCVMPNHVHALFQVWQGHPLGRILHSWKSHSARQINALLGRAGPLWQTDYFDTFMRDDDHLQAEATYIEWNPVKAKLVRHAHEWPWSSAARSAGRDP